MPTMSSDHWAYFGDGNAAQIMESREYIKKTTGLRYYKFIFLPSKRIEKTYDVSEEQDKRTGAIVREYKATDVVFLERGVYRTRCWIFTDINGGDTAASRRYKELTDTLNDSERLLRSAEAAKNRAYQELETERQQKKMALKSMADMVREVAKARGRVDEGQDVDTNIPPSM